MPDAPPINKTPPPAKVECAWFSSFAERHGRVTMNEMNARVRSALLGGLIAAVIWMVIATLTDGSKAFVVGWGLGLLVFTFVVSMIIARFVHRSR
jgi:hypothetical protein